MKYCDACRRYTLEDTCPHCRRPTRGVEPARFSPQDPYGEYRRKLKKQTK